MAYYSLRRAHEKSKVSRKGLSLEPAPVSPG